MFRQQRHRIHFGATSFELGHRSIHSSLPICVGKLLSAHFPPGMVSTAEIYIWEEARRDPWEDYALEWRSYVERSRRETIERSLMRGLPLVVSCPEKPIQIFRKRD